VGVVPATRPRTRDRILDVALDLFAEEGYSGTTITEVERRAGLSPGSGSFYRHFRSKDELLGAAVQHEVERIRTEIASARVAPTEDVVAGLALALRDLRRYDRLFRLALTAGDRVPAIREAITQALRSPHPGIQWEDGPEVALALTALGGYHLFSLVQGRPFEDIPEEAFLAAVAEVIDPPSR
jgi:AcrR family transcriptional regulator